MPAMPVAMAAFLAAAIASLLISLALCAVVLREPELRFKPIWGTLCFVGLGGGALVWEAPEQVYWFFGIAFPTVSFSTVAGSWQPELVRFLFPAGASLVALRVFWHRRSQARDASDGRGTS